MTEYYFTKYIHLAICTAGLYTFVGFSTGSDISLFYAVFLVSATIVLYNVHPYLHKGHISFFELSILLFFGTIAAIFFSIFADLILSRYILLSIACIACIFYFIPIPWANANLRTIPLLKPLTISMVFTILVVLIPFINESFVSITIVSTIVFWLIFILSIIFDTGDVEIDAKEKLTTIATMYSMQWIKQVSYSILIGLTVISLGAALMKIILWISCLSLIITFGLLVYCIYLLKPNQSKLFYLSIVDSFIIMPLIIYSLYFCIKLIYI